MDRLGAGLKREATNLGQIIGRLMYGEFEPAGPSPRPPMGKVTHESNLTRHAEDNDRSGFARRSRLKAPPP